MMYDAFFSVPLQSALSGTVLAVSSKSFTEPFQWHCASSLQIALKEPLSVCKGNEEGLTLAPVLLPMQHT
jgi:hypothetical protein